jgi:hypothetical protein
MKLRWLNWDRTTVSAGQPTPSTGAGSLQADPVGPSEAVLAKLLKTRQFTSGNVLLYYQPITN